MSIWFHTTDKRNIESIFKEGLTDVNTTREHGIGKGVYLAQGDLNDLTYWIQSDNPVIIAVEIDDNDLLADEDSIVGHGTYDVNPKFKDLVVNNKTLSQWSELIEDKNGDTSDLLPIVIKAIDKYKIKPQDFIGRLEINTARYPKSIPPSKIKAVLVVDNEDNLQEYENQGYYVDWNSDMAMIYPKNPDPDIISLLIA